ncbi:hypothetical protein ACHAXR_009465, partial [Thalassiosira sp. AJA248-18]
NSNNKRQHIDNNNNNSKTIISSTASTTTEGSKKRHREEDDNNATNSSNLTNSNKNLVGILTSNHHHHGGGIIESRDDYDTKINNSFLDDSMESMEEDDNDDNRSAGTMSLGGFSMGSLGRIATNEASSKRRKGHQAHPNNNHRSQSIHRTLSHGLNMNVDDIGNLKLLEVSSTLSEGKMILKNLSINSSYSAEFADLCASSPTNNNNSSRMMEGGADEIVVDPGKTPQRRNTSSKKKNTLDQMAPLVFRMDGGLTPAPSRRRHNNATTSTTNPGSGSSEDNNVSNNDDSPTMFDLIGGAETPTTGMLMNNIMESALTDDIRSLNGHLRGQSFTPLPMMMSENNDGGGLSGGMGMMSGGLSSSGGLSITPQLSWSTMNGSPLEITPRCFGLLDSTKSSKSLKSGMNTPGSSCHHPLGSPKSFWKDAHVLENRKCGGSSSSAGGNTAATPGSSADGKQGGVKSILSILSPTMREMDIVRDGGNDGNHRSTSPLPLYYKDGSGGQENDDDGKSSSPSDHHVDPKTPLRRPPIPSGIQSSPNVGPQPMPTHSSPWGGDYRDSRGGNNGSFAPSPIPHHHHHPHHGHHSTAASSPYRDGPPPPHPPPPGYPHHHHHHHSSMYPPSHHHPHHHHGHYNPHDRVRNLRGNGPPRHQMPPQHHLPPPSYHHFSPLTNVAAGHHPHGRGRYAGGHHGMMPHHLDLVTGTSKRKCVPIKPPIPSKFQGDIDKYKDAQIPEFSNLVNFPGHMNNKPSPNVPEGMRCCVMCGQACPCSTGGKNKKINKVGGGGGSVSGDVGSGGGVAPLGDSTGSNNNKGGGLSSSVVAATMASSSNSYANIPTQNKGLCTICDVNVWIVTSTGLEIKWCKGCKNFRPWAAFGDKGLATKCVRCRERQREKYALQKEEKEKARGMTKARMQQSQPQRQQQVRQVAPTGPVSMGHVSDMCVL